MKSQDGLNEIDVYVDYYDTESIVKGFLTLSALNRMDEFDFEAAFQYLRCPIESKLAEHGLGTFEEFCETHDIGYSKTSLEEFTYKTNYVCIDADDVLQAILRHRYETFRETFDGTFSDLAEIIEKIDALDVDNTKENVILFDKVIHAQHVTRNG
jgi:hypothetical protein